MRVQAQGVQLRFCAKKVVASPLVARGKTHSAVEYQRHECRLRVEGEGGKVRPAGAFPILQSCFEVAVEKINRGEEIVGVVVLGLNRERPAQVPFSQR